LSSQSPNTERANTASTSPMFVEQSHQQFDTEGVPSNSPSNKGSSTSYEKQVQSAVDYNRVKFTPPPSTQPLPHGHNGHIKREHLGHHFPSKIIDAFLSDDQQQAVSLPSIVLEPELCSKQSLNPEDAWKQA